MCDIIKEIKDEGKAEGKLNTLINLVNNKLLSLDVAASQAEMTKEEFEKLLSSN